MNWKNFKNDPPQKINSNPYHIDNICHNKWAEYIFDIYIETENSKYRLTVPVSYSTKLDWFIPGTFNSRTFECESLDSYFGENIEILFWDHFPYPNQGKIVT